MQTRNKAIALYKDILKLWGEIFSSPKSCKNFVVGETLMLKNVHNMLVCWARSLQSLEDHKFISVCALSRAILNK